MGRAIQDAIDGQTPCAFAPGNGQCCKGIRSTTSPIALTLRAHLRSYTAFRPTARSTNPLMRQTDSITRKATYATPDTELKIVDDST